MQQKQSPCQLKREAGSEFYGAGVDEPNDCVLLLLSYPNLCSFMLQTLALD
jgi:hypothetical protein